jgi:cation:H+ antiporter
MNLILFLGGLATLVVGADLLVRGASRLACRGLAAGGGPTVVASAPVRPSWPYRWVLGGKTDIALGNRSNIFNVLFILGLSALVTPLTVNLQLIRQEVPIMIGASLLLLLLGLDGRLGVVDGALLTGLLLVYTGFLIHQSRRQTQAAHDQYAAGIQVVRAGGWTARLPVQLALIVGGLVALVLGSDALVTASVTFAKALGVSDLVIGLTIIAAGTSMPELATSVAASIKGERDMAVGNVVGSCTFNVLGCLGVSALASGSAGLLVPAAALHFDLWVMTGVALACLPIFITGREIARWEGAVFLLYYVAYVSYR